MRTAFINLESLQNLRNVFAGLGGEGSIAAYIDNILREPCGTSGILNSAATKQDARQQ